MIRRYVCLGVFSASVMFCLAGNVSLTRPLWRLSFVPEGAARLQVSGGRLPQRAPLAGGAGKAPSHSKPVTSKGDADHSQQ